MKNRFVLTLLVGLPAAALAWAVDGKDAAFLAWMGVTLVALISWNADLQKEISYLKARLDLKA